MTGLRAVARVTEAIDGAHAREVPMRRIPDLLLNIGRRAGFCRVKCPAARFLVLETATFCRVAAVALVWLAGASSVAEQPSASQRPVRIVALAPNAAEIICSLGSTNRLVGVGRFCTFPADLKSLPKIGGLRDPDLEAILALHPDLIILRGRGSASEPIRRLAIDHGIQIYNDRVETLDDLYRTIRELGDLLDRRPQAKRLVHHIRTKLQSIATRATTRPKVKVLFTLRNPDSLTPLMTVGRRTFLNEIIEIAGGDNIFSDQDTRYPTVSLEEVVARNPTVIIESMPDQVIDRARRGRLLNQWRELTSVQAVQSGQVHFVTQPFLTIPSDRVILAAELLLSLIHPELRTGE